MKRRELNLTGSFSGFSVGIYGGLYSDHGNYTVDLDGQTVGNYNGTWFELAPGTPLFIANNLSEGPHRIIVTNLGKGPGGDFFDFDYAIVNSTVYNSSHTGGGPAGTNGTDLPYPRTADGGQKTPIGGIVGGTIGGILILAAFGIIALRILRRRKRDRAFKNEVDLTGDEIKPYHGPESAVIVSSTPGYGQSEGSTTLYHSSQPYLSSVPPPPASNATSYPHSENPPSTVGNAEYTEEEVGNGPPFNRGPSRKIQPLFATTIPEASSMVTANDYNASIVSESHSNPSSTTARMQIKGRATDLGPATLDEEDEEGSTLPPNYAQATQPLPTRIPAGRGVKQ